MRTQSKQLFAVLAALSSCAAPGLDVQRYVAPARYDLGDIQTVVLAAQGSDSALPWVVQPLRKRLAERLHLSLVDSLADGDAPGAPVLHLSVERASRDDAQVVNGPNGGRMPVVQRTEWMQVTFQLTRADGTELARGDYSATQSDFPREQRNATTDAEGDRLAGVNARQLADRIVDDLAPEQSTHHLAFADDPELQPGLRLALSGDRPQAETLWRALDSAGAHYNVAVLLEARGDVASALAEYERAAAASPEPRYQHAADALKKSLALRPRSLGPPPGP
jgi:hypothetical protein